QDFRTTVRRFHPLLQEANLTASFAEDALLRAKGGFDPKTYADYTQKKFNNKTYFQHTETGVKWPIWLGLELKSGYQLASGDFLDPENTLPDQGQASLGIRWSLGQGLLMDQRRADLAQARIGLLEGNMRRQLALSNLVLDAAKAYWSWAVADNQYRVHQEALEQARQRHAAIRESFRQGERSAMDTMESFIQWQNRTLDLNFAANARQMASQELGNFRWTTNNLPVDTTTETAENLQQSLSPASGLADSLMTNLQSTVAAHPQAGLYNMMLRQLDVDRRLKREKLKPELDLEYYLLGSGWQFYATPVTDKTPGILARDAKIGIHFSYPLLNRKARGDVEANRLKQIQYELLLTQKKQEIEAKLRQYANDAKTLATQTALYRDMTNNYRQLLDFEMERFRNGESSVFLVNTREQRWLDAQIKYIKLEGEYRKAMAGLIWSAGSW
ncbi:MAG: TolC family protein, partial [Saprospiraceae bacterium]|nr:TolC family protein [Saprospiraceae bacterium]